MQLLRIAIAVSLCAAGAFATYAWFAEMPGASQMQALYFAGPAVLSIGVFILETAFNRNAVQGAVPGMSLQRIGVIMLTSSTLLGLAIGVRGQDEGTSMLITVLVTLVALPGAFLFVAGIVATIRHTFRQPGGSVR